MQGVGDAVGERGRRDRRDRVQAGGGQPHAVEPLSAPSEPTASPMTSPIAELLDREQERVEQRRSSGSWIASMQPITSRIAIGSLRPDSPSSVRASRRGSVEPRSTANTAAASVAATVEPSSSAGSGSRSRMNAAATAVSAAVSERPERGQDHRRAQHGPDLLEAAGEAALEQDHRHGDDARLARELEVVEVDPAQPVGADQHPEAEHEHEAGQAETARREGGRETRRQQEAGEQEELTLVQEL